MSTPDHTGMSMVERLRLAFDAKALSVAEVAKACGIPYRTLQNYLLESRSPSSEALQKICATIKINANWLFSGHGNMFIGSSPEANYDKLNWILLEKIIESIESSLSSIGFEMDPKSKARSIGLLYADFGELAKQAPRKAADIFSDRKKFEQAITIFLLQDATALLAETNQTPEDIGSSFQVIVDEEAEVSAASHGEHSNGSQKGE